MRKFMNFFLIMVLLLWICTASYFLWVVGKRINYKLSYKYMVEQTVREMVKSECLKRGE